MKWWRFECRMDVLGSTTVTLPRRAEGGVDVDVDMKDD